MLDTAEIDAVVFLMPGARVSMYRRCRTLPPPQVDAAVGHSIAKVRAWLRPRALKVLRRCRQRVSPAA